MTDTDSKLAKLQHATDQAFTAWQAALAAQTDAHERLQAAKALLRQLPAEDQASISVNDTKLPELIGLHQLAHDACATAQKRYETNQRYLQLYQEKMGKK